MPRNSQFHRSLNQKLPELWSDFSDRGLPAARAGDSAQAAAFHGDYDVAQGSLWNTGSVGGLDDTNRLSSTSAGGSKNFAGSGAAQRGNAAAASSRPGHAPGPVVFVGYAEFDMDGRAHTAGEMDRLMMHAATSKYPCARPATFDEYAEGAVLGLPATNQSGRDVVFVGPGATGTEVFHTNTLGMQKCAVPPGDSFEECQWSVASLFGRKAMLCVYPHERLRRQRSLTHYGLARNALARSGRLKSAGSLACLSDTNRWSAGAGTAANLPQSMKY